jgi:hypothetical protein
MFAIATGTNTRNSLQFKVNPSKYYNAKTMKSAIDVARYFLCRWEKRIRYSLVPLSRDFVCVVGISIAE